MNPLKMISTARPALLLALLLACSVSFGIVLEAMAARGDAPKRRQGDLLQTLLGDGRRLFSNHFFTKADVYFHSGYYPSIFDNREAFQTAHMAEDAGLADSKNQGDEHEFMGEPRDWIERLGRNFRVATHTHLDEGGSHSHDHDHHHDHDQHGAKGEDRTREILPWLKFASVLNPEDVRTYVVAAYWLRERMDKVSEAEQLLREGLRHNPLHPELLLELGRLTWEAHKDSDRARNIWDLALKSWKETEGVKTEPDLFLLRNILINLAGMEEKIGDYNAAIHYQQLLLPVTPTPEVTRESLVKLRAKLAESAAAAPEKQ
jgi:tetratricopeptide (TPR) repeat protein